MKEKKPPKQIKITNEAYEKLKKIGDESYSMTDRINYLIDGQAKKIDTVPYAVAQAVILHTTVLITRDDSSIEFYIINRKDIMTMVPEKLINLGWDKVHPELFEDLKSWRCPIKVFLDNVIKSLTRDKILFKHTLDPREFSDVDNSDLVNNYAINTNISKTSIIEHLDKTYLMTAEDYLSTYEDDGYTKRMTLEEVSL